MTPAEKAQAWITIDESGKDQDTIMIRGPHGHARTVLISSLSEGATLIDGTRVTRDDLQLAFQEKLISVTGKCVLEHEYANAGFPGLATGALIARTD